MPRPLAGIHRAPERSEDYEEVTCQRFVNFIPLLFMLQLLVQLLAMMCIVHLYGERSEEVSNS